MEGITKDGISHGMISPKVVICTDLLPVRIRRIWLSIPLRLYVRTLPIPSQGTASEVCRRYGSQCSAYPSLTNCPFCVRRLGRGGCRLGPQRGSRLTKTSVQTGNREHQGNSIGDNVVVEASAEVYDAFQSRQVEVKDTSLVLYNIEEGEHDRATCVKIDG